MAPVPWTPQQKLEFLGQQFDAQDEHYRKNYPGADLLLIEVDDEAAGRFYVKRLASEIRVMDIALLPAYRGRGIGTRILEDLIAEADATGRTVTIHVERFNPALKLYERLGFRATKEVGIYFYLVRDPAPAVIK